jgi:HD-like signal output (HDOD) protein
LPSFIEGLHGLLKSGTQLPTLPTVVFQLHAVLDDDRKGPIDVAAVIQRDPALTTRLLRAANSAMYHRGDDRVASVYAATQRIGMDQVRSLCLVLAVVQAFGGRRRVMSHEALWTHSGAVGAVARHLYGAAGRPGSLSVDDVYVAGLLHDVGLLVLDQLFAKEFDELHGLREEIELPLWQHEEDMLGMDHGDIGGLLLGSWSLPAAVVDAVTYQHRPAEAPEQHRMVCHAVHAAELLCTELGRPLDDELPVGGDRASALEALGFTAEQQVDLEISVQQLMSDALTLA